MSKNNEGAQDEVCPMEDVNGYCRTCDHFTECFDVLADLVGPDEEEDSEQP